nr:hypothetical protein CFP56_71753 [Quercus suber]
MRQIGHERACARLPRHVLPTPALTVLTRALIVARATEGLRPGRAHECSSPNDIADVLGKQACCIHVAGCATRAARRMAMRRRHTRGFDTIFLNLARTHAGDGRSNINVILGRLLRLDRETPSRPQSTLEGQALGDLPKF